jgi:hypothetical protein
MCTIHHPGEDLFYIILEKKCHLVVSYCSVLRMIVLSS